MYEYLNIEKLLKFELGRSRGLTTIVSHRSRAAVRKITLGLLCVQFNHEWNTKV
jgi:hypothetical protein